jgi:hypothetical protein
MKLQSFWTKIEDSTRDTLTDNRPDWLYEAVQAAHVSDLPNDWIYAECRAACDAIDDGSIACEDDIHEHADSRVDVYTKDLYQWAADMCLSDTFAQAESDVEDMGGDSRDDTLQRIRELQYFAISRIARTVFEAWEENT